MDSSWNALHDTVNKFEGNFDRLRDDIIVKLDECSQFIKSAKLLCEQAAELNQVLEQKLDNVSEEEKEWRDIKAKLAQTSIQGKVILNVGGEKYTTSVETLTREKNTFFTALFSKQWELEKDPNDGSIFIDRNGKIFAYIIEYLRTPTVPDSILKDEKLLQNLFIEAEYYHLWSLVDQLMDASFYGGTLLQMEHKKILNTFYGKSHQRWELIYKATRDGFNANVFHSRCNNKGPTMTIIRSQNNYLFGGYTSIPWTSDNSYKTDSTAFLFTLTNPHNIPPTKYIVNAIKAGNAVYHNNSYGPTFGSGHDIFMTSDSNISDSSYIRFPKAYTDTTHMGDKTFTGFHYFQASDIEVFRLV